MIKHQQNFPGQIIQIFYICKTTKFTKQDVYQKWSGFETFNYSENTEKESH